MLRKMNMVSKIFRRPWNPNNYKYLKKAQKVEHVEQLLCWIRADTTEMDQTKWTQQRKRNGQLPVQISQKTSSESHKWNIMTVLSSEIWKPYSLYTCRNGKIYINCILAKIQYGFIYKGELHIMEWCSVIKEKFISCQVVVNSHFVQMWNSKSGLILMWN